MCKKIYLILLAVSMTLTASPQSRFLVDDVTIPPEKQGEIVVKYQFDAEDSYTAYSFDLVLPDGISLAKDANGAFLFSLGDCHEDHGITINYVEEEKLYAIACLSLHSTPLQGLSGVLLTLYAEASNLPEEQETKMGKISNVKLFHLDGVTKYRLEEDAFDVTYGNSKIIMGDVNGDEKINGSDIVELVDHIMERPSDRFVEAAADLSGDGKINGSDLTLEIELVMSQEISPAPMQPDFSGNGLSISNHHDGTMSVSVDGGKGYILAQMVVELSPGQKLEGFHTDNTHKVACRRLSDNRYFVLCYSSGNAPFSSNDDILTIRYSGEGDASICNAMLVDETRTECHFNPVCSGDATGIAATLKDITQAVDVYSLDGALVKKQATSLEGLPKGVYLVNGNKLFIK